MAVIQIIIGIYCIVLVFNIIYLIWKMSLFGQRVKQLTKGSSTSPESYEAFELMPEAMRLTEIHKKISSDSSSDWKIAIIELDKILDKSLENKGFKGDGLGERLKQMAPSDLPEIYEEIWEAHKIRNRIVHEPNFEITKSNAQKLAGIYERALKRIK